MSEQCTGCGSACKKDPLSGVIGVQKAPLILTVQERTGFFGGKIGISGRTSTQFLLRSKMVYF